MVTGTRGPENVDSARVIADVQDEIVLVRPSAAPFMTLSNKFRDSRTATQRRFDWFEKDEYPRTVVLLEAALVADTSLVVESGQGARIAGRFVLLNVRTRESVYVTSVSTDTLTVTRAIGGEQADMDAGDTLVFTRPVAEDGAGIGTLKSITEVNKFNYTEIIRTPYGFTGRQENTDLYGGKDPMTERKWHSIEHKKSIESMYFFGRRNLITGAGGHEVTFSGGLEDYIVSNVWDVSGITLSARAFVEFLEVAMREGRGGNRNGSATKFLFAADRWITEIEFWAADKLLYEPLDSELGLTARSYTSTHGKVMILPSPVISENHPDMAFLVDLNHITPVTHQGRGTKLLRNREGNDIDGSQEEYMSDLGVQVELEFAHAILKGLPA
jgi:hypothetical protein